MHSRLPSILWTSLAFLCLIALFYAFDGVIRRHNTWVAQDKADSVYLNQEIGKMKDGTPITRKLLIDMLIVQAAREAQNFQQIEKAGPKRN